MLFCVIYSNFRRTFVPDRYPCPVSRRQPSACCSDDRRCPEIALGNTLTPAFCLATRLLLAHSVWCVLIMFFARISDAAASFYRPVTQHNTSLAGADCADRAAWWSRQLDAVCVGGLDCQPPATYHGYRDVSYGLRRFVRVVRRPARVKLVTWTRTTTHHLLIPGWAGHTLYSRIRELLTQRFYKRNIDRSSSCLDYLLPEQRDFLTKLRCANKYQPFRTRTERFRNSFILYTVCLISVANS